MDWKTVLERDGPTAWRAAYRLLGHAADADDCLQEAVLGAVQLARREPIANIRAVLTRLASARAIDRLRKRYRSRIQGAVEEPHVPFAELQGSDTSLDLEELRSQLRDALAQLSPEQATAFSLCALEGWTYTDAGQQLQTPANTIGTLVHRARLRLRELLKNLDPTLPRSSR